jgi:hypothetical protein
LPSPVVPEVKAINATSSAAVRTLSNVAGFVAMSDSTEDASATAPP